MQLSEIHTRGTRAAQPDATTQPEGTLYYVTDESVLEMVTGGAWTEYSSTSSGAPTTADYLVGTANGSLSAEIVVGTSPGGELGGSWSSPTVDTTHSGSSHSAIPYTPSPDNDDWDSAAAPSDGQAGLDQLAARVAVLERAQDVGAHERITDQLFAGTNITLTEGGDSNALTISASGGGGTLWTSAGPGVNLITAPSTSGWSWDNQSVAVATEPTSHDSNEMTMASGSGSGLHIRYRTAPATPYTITALLHAHGRFGVSFLRFGLTFRESSSGALAYIGQRMESSGGILGSAKYTNSTTFSADYTTLTLTDYTRFIWFRLADNSTNRIVSWSWDGVNFIQLHSVLRTDFLTADQVGWFIQTEAGADLAVNLISWVEA